MISSRTTKSRAMRQLATLIVLVFCCMSLPVGCGEPATHESNIPPEFVEKLEKEHPELFVVKTGKNQTGVLGGRERRAVLRREWLRAQQGNP